MSLEIGKKVKKLRNEQELTLKDLSEMTSLSTGFLSQLERGLTTVAIDSLESISKALGVDLSYFFVRPTKKQGHILKSYEKEILHIEDTRFIHYQLSKNIEDKEMMPRLIEILPSNSDEEIVTYTHKGEEFVYVLEGILTLFLDGERYELYPGDSSHISSLLSHNWANYTNKLVKILAVSIPNEFKVEN